MGKGELGGVHLFRTPWNSEVSRLISPKQRICNFFQVHLYDTLSGYLAHRRGMKLVLGTISACLNLKEDQNA